MDYGQSLVYCIIQVPCNKTIDFNMKMFYLRVKSYHSLPWFKVRHDSTFTGHKLFYSINFINLCLKILFVGEELLNLKLSLSECFVLYSVPCHNNYYYSIYSIYDKNWRCIKRNI